MSCKSVFVGSSATASSLPWYAIRVRTHCEAAAASVLRNRGYAEFLPMYRRRVPRYRRKELEFPLLPGYVFARFDLTDDRLPILQIPSVLYVVGVGKIPEPVDVAEITALQTVVASCFATGPWPFLRVGDRVVIEGGPLSGIEGILVVTKNEYRVVVSITLLQRSVAVEIDREWVRPLNRPHGPVYAGRSRWPQAITA
jgi:transcription antitermination factor NusG